MQLVGALTGGLEETEKMIQRGWMQVRLGRPDDAWNTWMRVVQVPAVDALYQDFQIQVERLAASPRTRDLPLPPLLLQGLAQVNGVLSNAEAELRVGRVTLEGWQQRFLRLRTNFQKLADEYRAREVPNDVAERLGRLPEARERLAYLRERAGFASPHDLEKESGVAWGTLSRAETGRRGMGSAGSRDRARFILEGRINLALTLTFKPLRIPLHQEVNSIETVEQRFRFVLEDLLGWSYNELVRSAQRLKGPGGQPLDSSEQKVPFDRMRPVTRHFFRDTLRQGLREQYGESSAPILDGNLRIWNGSLEEALRSFADVGSRLDWLMGDLLIWSGNRLMQESGVTGHVGVRPPANRSRPAVQRWALLRGGLEKGLRQMGYEVMLDDALLPLPPASPFTGLEEFRVGQRFEQEMRTRPRLQQGA